MSNNDRSKIKALSRIKQHHETEQYSLPHDMDQFALLRLIKRVAPRIGLNDTLLRQYELMLSITQEIDWQEGNLCICWYSVERMAEELGKSVRTVQYNTDRLIEMGLISMRLSGNYRRGGQRDSLGCIKWASGADMKPVIEQLDDIINLAEEMGREIEERQLYAKKISSVRREIRMFLDNRQTDLGELAESAWKTITKRPRISWSLNRLASLWGELQQLWADLTALIAVDNCADECASVGNNCSHGCNQLQTLIQTTTQTPIISVEASGDEPPLRTNAARGDTPHADHSPPIHGDGGIGRKIDMVEAGQMFQFISNNSAFTVTQSQSGLRDNGEKMCRLLGISPDAWQQAVNQMGVTVAAAAVATIEAKGRVILRPGGYLRAMTEKAKAGKLHLAKTIKHYS